MLLAVVRAFGAMIFAAGLWTLWRRLPQAHGIRTIVGLGLLARGLLGAALFWISYLQLPIARSMQVGNGIWFFGVDGAAYFDPAIKSANRGLGAVLTMTPTTPSAFFSKVLGVAAWMFGPTVSVAVLLNLFAYVALCLILIAISTRVGGNIRALVFSLVAVSFSPSWILWALQPMKETFFLCTVSAYLLAVGAWADRVRIRNTANLSWLPATIAAALLLYMLAGIRWYFALMLFLAAIGVALVVATIAARRLRAAAAFVVLGLVMSQMIPLGAGPYLPPWAARILQPAWHGPAGPRSHANPLETMDDARGHVQFYKGGTDIQIVHRSNAGTTASLPATPYERLFAGTVAMFLPRFIAAPLHLIEMGGGRGLWLLADFDTVVFDAVLLVALLLSWRAMKSGARAHPIFWQTALTALLLLPPLAYTAVNFGTLFRQRAMIYALAVILPVAVGTISRRDTTPPPR